MKGALAEMPALRTRPLFEMQLAVDPMRLVGGPPGGNRRIGDIPGGCFSGERLRGRVLAGGSDWQTVQSDGAVQLDGRILLETEDHALIAMTYIGIRHGPQAVMARLARGEDVDPQSYYFRVMPSFATSHPDYDWLNRVLTLGVGHRRPEGPTYFVHEIL